MNHSSLERGRGIYLLLFSFLMVTVAERPVNKIPSASPLAPPVASYGKATPYYLRDFFTLQHSIISPQPAALGQPAVLVNEFEPDL